MKIRKLLIQTQDMLQQHIQKNQSIKSLRLKNDIILKGETDKLSKIKKQLKELKPQTQNNQIKPQPFQQTQLQIKEKAAEQQWIPPAMNQYSTYMGMFLLVFAVGALPERLTIYTFKIMVVMDISIINLELFLYEMMVKNLRITDKLLVVSIHISHLLLMIQLS